MNIILIGYRGVGKSSVSKLLSERLDYERLSTDEMLAIRFGNLQEYIKNCGWKKFREIEKDFISELSCKGKVVDCGGGVVEEADNRKRLKELGKVIWLKADPSTIEFRLNESNDRLSLTESSDAVSEIYGVLEKRNPLYRETSHIVIETDNKEIEQIVDEIILLVKG